MELTSLSHLDELVESSVDPVILVEGTRDLPEGAATLIREFGSFLVSRYPSAIFRTGNATGSDTEFAAVIAAVAPERLQYVVPNVGMGRARRHESAQLFSLRDVSPRTAQILCDASLDASPKSERLISAYAGKVTNRRLAGMGQYLVRDTLKVLGAAELALAPATAGIFYVKDRAIGGTGHTIRVCDNHAAPSACQSSWSCWV